MLIREKQEQQEHEILNPYASFMIRAEAGIGKKNSAIFGQSISGTGIGSFTVRRFVV